MKNKVLIIAAHMDDETLGCAGTICKHKAVNDNVTVIFVAHRKYNHVFDKRKNDREIAHALRAKKILGYDKAIFLGLSDERLDACLQDIIIPLESHVNKIRPAIVYIPFQSDNNQDHRAVFDAARVIFRPMFASFVKEINMYEVPSSTEQSPPLPENAFLPNYYIDITNYVKKKISAINCYETEKRRYPHPRSSKAIGILVQKRGTEIGYDYAEAFVSLRRKWK